MKEIIEAIFSLLIIVYYFFNLAIAFMIYWFWAWVWCIIMPIAPMCYLVDKYL